MPTINEYRPKVHTDQIFITRRKMTRSHELTTVSQCPKPLRRAWYPTFTHDSMVWDPWRSVITLKWGTWRITKNVGWLPIKGQETDEAGDEKIGGEGKTLPNWNQNLFYTDFGYTLSWKYYSKFIQLKPHCFPVNTLYWLKHRRVYAGKPPASLTCFCERRFW